MATRERPISPHMQVYRWQVQMVTSMLHRATGILLAVGILLFPWGLSALAAGPQAWARFTGFLGSLPGWLIVVAGVWALSYHLINGIRHLLQDAGLGFSIPAFVRSSWISVIGSVLLAALLLGCVFARLGGAA